MKKQIKYIVCLLLVCSCAALSLFAKPVDMHSLSFDLHPLAFTNGLLEYRYMVKVKGPSFLEASSAIEDTDAEFQSSTDEEAEDLQQQQVSKKRRAFKGEWLGLLAGGQYVLPSKNFRVTAGLSYFKYFNEKTGIQLDARYYTDLTLFMIGGDFKFNYNFSPNVSMNLGITTPIKYVHPYSKGKDADWGDVFEIISMVYDTLEIGCRYTFN